MTMLNTSTPSILDGMSVLVVQDEMMAGLGLKKTFCNAGAYEVTLVGSVEDAWDALARAQFDLAILDLHLPDGYSFPLAIDLYSKGLPVLMPSPVDDIRQSPRLPGIVFCPKPATPTEIMHAAHKAINLTSFAPAAQLLETLH